MQTQPERPWHAITWSVWALASAGCIQLAPSPVYTVIVVAIAWLMVSTHGLDLPFARAFGLLVGIAAFFAVFRVVLTAATTHGSEDLLFTTPSFRMPEILGGFDVGGAVSAPIVLRALSEGLVIVAIIAVFAAFNAVVSHFELVQTIPRAFYELGLVVVVALAFVPSTIAAIHDVREADRARTGGRVVRRGRLVRQVVPVLERGLEQAVTLAESLDSRGFAHGGATSRERGAGWTGLGALMALGAAFVALVARERTVALALAGLGAAGMVLAIRFASVTTRRIRYRPRHITTIDRCCIVGTLLAPALLSVLALTGEQSLTWTPSPLTWPALHALPVLALTPLLLPLVRQRRANGRASVHPVPRPEATAERSEVGT